MPPLIVTLTLAPPAQAVFEALRRRYFPPERNVIDAHLTLFHALDGNRESAVLDDIAALHQRAFDISATGPRSLGHGVAIAISSVTLMALRAALARQWADMLTPQDRQGFSPHVTIQNKVTAAQARALHAELQQSFAPFSAAAIGVAVWRYRGGPWDPVTMVPFAPS